MNPCVENRRRALSVPGGSNPPIPRVESSTRVLFLLKKIFSKSLYGNCCSRTTALFPAPVLPSAAVIAEEPVAGVVGELRHGRRRGTTLRASPENRLSIFSPRHAPPPCTPGSAAMVVVGEHRRDVAASPVQQEAASPSTFVATPSTFGSIIAHLR
jgi:hypothetical protein